MSTPLGGLNLQVAADRLRMFLRRDEKSIDSECDEKESL